MAETPDSSPLQFDRADYAQGAPPPTCASCSKPIDRVYYEANGQVVCRHCVAAMQAERASGSALGRFLGAAAAGTGAAALGSGLYFGVAALTGYEFGLIAIVVGFAVGAAVRWGSRGRGGWLYQTLAILLTYLAIVATYIPPVLSALSEHEQQELSAVDESETSPDATADMAAGAAATEKPTLAHAAVGVILLLAIACAAPFLAGVQNIIGLLIISFGLYEAWKMNRRTPLAISGPHAIGRPPQVATAGA
jgi:hypothetical protein